MPKTLAQGRSRVAVLTAAPTVPGLPTVTQLNGGIGTTTGVSCNIAADDFVFGATDSDRVADRALCDGANAEALGASNYQAGLSVYRYYDAAGLIAGSEDILYTAMKTKGTQLWIYHRQTGKLSTAAFAIGDELFGALVITDTPQRVQDSAGYIKVRIPLLIQTAYPDIVLAA